LYQGNIMATPIYQRPVELLQNLIRFDTTNPPGNEYACVMYLKGLLDESGIESTIVAKDPNRPCLIARIAGRGSAPPLLLYGHVDVVSTRGQPWTHDPFAADLIDGMVWGRGTLDMKGGVAMMTSAFMRAHAEASHLPGDVILCIVPDEEVDGIWGARYLVEEHADLFEGVRYAIGEFGGYPVSFLGKRFYTVTVGEKQTCSLIATVHGSAGHAALPHRGGAAAKLGRMLTALDQRRLPVHITPPIRQMIETIASYLDADESAQLRGLLDPARTDAILDHGIPDGQNFDALLHNTVNATVFRGGSQVNVAPSEITVELDGRILPGMTTDDLISEIYDVIGRDTADLRINVYDPGPGEADMGLFDMLSGVLRETDPDAIPVPFVMCGVTDARFFCQIGIQTYGFLPMNLPDGMDIWGTVHNADERVPAYAIEFGANTIHTALQRFT
jgi:acetylornithine deacetylase/succinyl-diaminopimelate desuccinylase-like protein